MVATPRSRRRVQAVTLAVAVLVAGVGASIWSRVASSDDVELVRLGDSTVVDPTATNPSRVGDPLPDVALIDVDGQELALRSDGRPMVVNIWHTNCGPCARELQWFAEVDAELGDEVRFVGVDPLDDVDRMVEFARDRGVDYELLRDEEFALIDAIGLVWYPATLFVSADGEIVAQTGELSAAELRSHIEHLLG